MTFLESCVPVLFVYQSATLGFFLSVFLSNNENNGTRNFNPPVPIYEENE